MLAKIKTKPRLSTCRRHLNFLYLPSCVRYTAHAPHRQRAFLRAVQPGKQTTPASDTSKSQPSARTAPPATTASQAVKDELLSVLNGLDRGIFGITAAQRATITSLLTRLESANPVPAPAHPDNLHLCAGSWTLLFSTITITGSRRTKLGLRGLVRLGEVEQHIDASAGEATNTVSFGVEGLVRLQGELCMRASFTPVSDTQVKITLLDARMIPPKFQAVFEASFSLLLSIFDPQGCMVVTYLDDAHRVCRDDRGHVYFLRRGRRREQSLSVSTECEQ